MYSYGPPHMAEQKQDDQLEHTYSSYVRIRDVALKTYQRRWTIWRSGESGTTWWWWWWWWWLYYYRTLAWWFECSPNGPGAMGSIPSHVISKTLKMVLDTSLLNTQQYTVRIKGKVEQSREKSSAFPYTSV